MKNPVAKTEIEIKAGVAKGVTLLTSGVTPGSSERRNEQKVVYAGNTRSHAFIAHQPKFRKWVARCVSGSH